MIQSTFASRQFIFLSVKSDHNTTKFDFQEDLIAKSLKSCEKLRKIFAIFAIFQLIQFDLESRVHNFATNAIWFCAHFTALVYTIMRVILWGTH